MQQKLIGYLLICTLIAGISVIPINAQANNTPCGSCDDTLFDEAAFAKTTLSAVLVDNNLSQVNDFISVLNRNGEGARYSEVDAYISDYGYVLTALIDSCSEDGSAYTERLFNMHTYSSGSNITFTYMLNNGVMTITNYTNNRYGTVYNVIDLKDYLINNSSSKEEEAISCEAWCNAIVGVLGCHGFCTYFNLGSGCTLLCGATAILFCNDVCNGKAGPINYYVRDCGYPGLPDCSK